MLGPSYFATASSVLSGRESFGVAREQGRLADVVQAAEQHDYSLQPHASAAVGHGAVLEGVNVGLDALQGDAARLCTLCGRQGGVHCTAATSQRSTGAAAGLEQAMA